MRGILDWENKFILKGEFSLGVGQGLGECLCDFVAFLVHCYQVNDFDGRLDIFCKDLEILGRVSRAEAKLLDRGFPFLRGHSVEKSVEVAHLYQNICLIHDEHV